jgi:signal transduction histidine kinase
MRTRSLSFLVLLVIGASLLIAGCVQSQPAGTNTTPAQVSTPLQTNVNSQESLVSFVDTAVLYAQAHDKDKTLATFSNQSGPFVKGDIYVFAYDFNGTTLALPFQPELVGVNRLDVTDSQGEFFVRDQRDTARNGSGFVNYTYLNPAHNNTVESKLSYVEKVDDTWWLGSGIYTGPAVPAATSSQAVPK